MKNRFAQLLYGKVIYIFETNLRFDDLSTIFSPTTYWVDVTGLNCEVGYSVDFKDNVGLVFTSPENTNYTFEQEKNRVLELINNWTEKKIINGFDSSASGELAYYDSDKDTQLTMQGIALNINTPLFDEKYPNGCPIRGYRYNNINGEVVRESNKTIFMLTSEQIMQWCADLSLYIGECKKQGWTKQAEVNKCNTIEELNKIVIE